MAGERDYGIGARLAIGGIAGLAATFALTSTAKRLLPRSDAAAPDLLDLMLPFAFGAVSGALLAAANPRPGRITGALAGGGLWLAGEVGLLPAITIGPAQGRPRGARSRCSPAISPGAGRPQRRSGNCRATASRREG